MNVLSFIAATQTYMYIYVTIDTLDYTSVSLLYKCQARQLHLPKYRLFCTKFNVASANLSGCYPTHNPHMHTCACTNFFISHSMSCVGFPMVVAVSRAQSCPGWRSSPSGSAPLSRTPAAPCAAPGQSV